MKEILATLLGTVVGGILGYVLSVAQARQIARSSASLALRDAFKNELLALDQSLATTTSDVPQLLQSAFDRHRKAVFEFSWHLSQKEKPRFERVWQEYYTHPSLVGRDGIPWFEQYSTRGKGHKEVREVKELAASRINKILDFTQETRAHWWPLPR